MSDVTPPRNLTELFLGFLSIGARSFGGVMPWAYRVMVEERRWITAADFTETVGLCQFLPGPNIGNTSGGARQALVRLARLDRRLPRPGGGAFRLGARAGRVLCRLRHHSPRAGDRDR